MGKRTGGKRGAPFGNSNRLKHGRWSKARLAKDRELAALIRQTRYLIIRANMVARARRAFYAVQKSRAKAIARITELLNGPYVLGGESVRLLTHQLSVVNRIAMHDKIGRAHV